MTTRRTHLFSLAHVLAVALTLGSAAAHAQSPSIVMASTTSTEQSGLFAHLLPAFKQASGVDIKVVALGTGQALDTGRRGDADVLFVHDQAAEEKFVAEGFGVKRYPVMYNDFVLVGPANDPAKHAHVKTDLAQKFVDWVISPAGQTSINSYKIGGEQLFFANAGK